MRIQRYRMVPQLQVASENTVQKFNLQACSLPNARTPPSSKNKLPVRIPPPPIILLQLQVELKLGLFSAPEESAHHNHLSDSTKPQSR